MGGDNKTPPIIGQDFMYGLNVVDIGDIRVMRGLTRRPHSVCRHKALAYDPKERRIWCEDCETDVEPFDAFVLIAEHVHDSLEKIKKMWTEVKEAQNHNIIRIAAKQMDEHFRAKNSVPNCPHCHEAIFPEDVSRMSSTGREIALAKRRKKEAP